MKKDKVKRRRMIWSRDDTELTLLGLPAVIWYALFCYLPMFGLIIAFKNFKLTPGKNFLYSLFHSEWAGFDNFKFFLTSNTFTMLLRNTLLYNKFASKAYQTLMFFPYFMSWVVISYFVYAFLNPDKGLANNLIMALGGNKVMWYSQPKYWPFILTFMQVWKSMGYNMVVYLASITGIDGTLYEAAMLDGATKWQQTRHITLPSLKPIIVMMFILNVGHIFYSDFGLFFQVTQGIPNSLYNAASTFDTYVFQALQSNVGIGKTAAAGMFQAVCCCVTVLIANFIVSKIDEESAII